MTDDNEDKTSKVNKDVKKKPKDNQEVARLEKTIKKHCNYNEYVMMMETILNYGKNIIDNKLSSWWVCFITISAFGFGTRQIGLDKPRGTVWDEVHFGGFMNHYINRTFFHDVHPPLGKLLIAATGWVTGYNASFNFNEGTPYEGVDYVTMRSVMALFGGSLIPLTFLTVWELSFSLSAATTASVFVICDTFVHRLNTLIILDPPLMTAIMSSIYLILKFHNQRHKVWQKVWWMWLIATGVSLGLVMSIKYIGAFTVLVVGTHTVYQLLCIICDKEQPWWMVIPHTAARALCLIIIPPLVYLLFFLAHFSILTQWSENGGAFYHTRFYSSFNNTEYHNVSFPKHIIYGDTVTIQNTRPMVGYLESWFDLFPSEFTGPCQQVTLSTIRDFEALSWVVKKVDIEKGAVLDFIDPKDNVNGSVLYVSNGDHVMLTHRETGRSLRSHAYRAAVVKRHYQVCGNGDDGEGGPFETWQIWMPGLPVGAPLEVLKGEFLLRHYKMQCFLKGSEDVVLPKAWAFNGAKEVSCTKNVKETGLRWHINWVNTTRKTGTLVSPQNYTMGFWEKLVYIHQAMLIGNSALKPTEEDLERSAKPWMWPLMFQLQTFGVYSIVNSTDERYVVGSHNPIVAYFNVLSMIGVGVLFIFHLYENSRNPNEETEAKDCRKKTLEICGWLLVCWGFHYIPFWGMGRILYIHHYCPAFVYSCMISGVMVDYICKELSTRVRPMESVNTHLVILSFPIAFLFISYIIVFPLATSLRGTSFEKHPQIRQIFDFFDFGQRWCELGYNLEFITKKFTTKRDPWKENVLSNPDVNATLYYKTKFNNTLEADFPISPVAASNFTSWTSPITVDNIDTALWTLMDNALNSTNVTNESFIG